MSIKDSSLKDIEYIPIDQTMDAKDHVHSYRKIKSRPGYFMCTAPTCTHEQLKEKIVGKLVRCPKCGIGFLADNRDLRYSIVVCKMCHNSPQAKLARQIFEATQNMDQRQFEDRVIELAETQGHEIEEKPSTKPDLLDLE